MKLGFTGTREGCTDRQLAWLYALLEDRTIITEAHHGACIGGDLEVHRAALDAGVPGVHVWPPVNTRYLAEECLIRQPNMVIHPAMPYLNRDREIVKATDGLIALPKQDKQPDRALWGGTWYTVEFAVRVRKPVVICYPSGVVEQRL